MSDIPPYNCQFEVTNPVEAGRVQGYPRETEFTSMIVSELRASDVLYDIGACIGMLTIHAVKAAGCKVVAFEPDPALRLRLARNLALNQASGVQLVAWAVSNKEGTTTLFTDGIESASPSLMSTQGQTGTISVPVDTIDNAIHHRRIPAPSVIKMDIEGAEMLALQGMSSLLGSPQAPRAIFLEMHPTFLPAFGCTEADVHRLLESHGYREAWAAKRMEERHYLFRHQAAATI